MEVSYLECTLKEFTVFCTGYISHLRVSSLTSSDVSHYTAVVQPPHSAVLTIAGVCGCVRACVGACICVCVCVCVHVCFRV